MGGCEILAQVLVSVFAMDAELADREFADLEPAYPRSSDRQPPDRECPYGQGADREGAKCQRTDRCAADLRLV